MEPEITADLTELYEVPDWDYDSLIEAFGADDTTAVR